MGFVNADFTYNKIDWKSETSRAKIYTDNWRVVSCAAVSVSDFDDD
jgi:hypothetical protein